MDDLPAYYLVLMPAYEKEDEARFGTFMRHLAESAASTSFGYFHRVFPDRKDEDKDRLGFAIVRFQPYSYKLNPDDDKKPGYDGRKAALDEALRMFGQNEISAAELDLGRILANSLGLD